MTAERFEKLKEKYLKVKEEANKQGEYAVFFKIGYLQGELEDNQEGLNQKQVLELMNILF